LYLTFFIPINISRDTNKNTCRSSCKVPVIFALLTETNVQTPYIQSLNPSLYRRRCITSPYLSFYRETVAKETHTSHAFRIRGVASDICTPHLSITIYGHVKISRMLNMT
jgi:hypothetical protein